MKYTIIRSHTKDGKLTLHHYDRRFLEAPATTGTSSTAVDSLPHSRVNKSEDVLM